MFASLLIGLTPSLFLLFNRINGRAAKPSPIELIGKKLLTFLACSKVGDTNAVYSDPVPASPTIDGRAEDLTLVDL